MAGSVGGTAQNTVRLRSQEHAKQVTGERYVAHVACGTTCSTIDTENSFDQYCEELEPTGLGCLTEVSLFELPRQVPPCVMKCVWRS